MPLAIPLDSCTPDEFNAAFDDWLTEQRPLGKYDPLPGTAVRVIERLGTSLMPNEIDTLAELRRGAIEWTPEIARRVQDVIERAAALPSLPAAESVEINRLAALGRTQPFRNTERVHAQRGWY